MAEVKYIQGLSQLQDYLARFPAAVGSKVLRKGANAGAQVVKRFVINAAPLGKSTPRHVAGTLKRSVRVIFARAESNDGQAVYQVTFHKGQSAQSKLTRKGAAFTLPDDGFYAPFVERGHRIVARKTNGTGRTLQRRRQQSAASVPPHPFLEPAFAASRDSAINAMIDAMTKGISDLT